MLNSGGPHCGTVLQHVFRAHPLRTPIVIDPHPKGSVMARFKPQSEQSVWMTVCGWDAGSAGHLDSGKAEVLHQGNIY